jgi:hypothetical protein
MPEEDFTVDDSMLAGLSPDQGIVDLGSAFDSVLGDADIWSPGAGKTEAEPENNEEDKPEA